MKFTTNVTKLFLTLLSIGSQFHENGVVVLAHDSYTSTDDRSTTVTSMPKTIDNTAGDYRSTTSTSTMELLSSITASLVLPKGGKNQIEEVSHQS